MGRQPDTAVHMIRAADIQYLGCDYLAELTLSIMAKQQLKDPTKGFAPDFVARLLKEAGKEAWQKGIRITTNAGGMNVTGCVDSIRQWAEGQGIMAGHLLECGGQGAGGNYMYDWCHVPQMDELGFPIAELTEDSFHITKVPMSSRLRFPATGTTPIPIPFREKNLNGERESLYFANMNRNKKGITLNLKTQEGKELFKQLATFFTMWTTDWTRPAACGSGMRRKLINFLLMATDTFSPLRK